MAFFPAGNPNELFTTLYGTMPTRAGPYALGMYVGYLHVNNKDYNFCKGKVIQEWLAFIMFIGWSLIGCLPTNAFPGDTNHGFPLIDMIPPGFNCFIQLFGRLWFGAVVSYLVLLMVSP